MTGIRAKMQKVADEQLARARSMSYTQLLSIRTPPSFAFTSGWRRGEVWTEVAAFGPRELRVAVLQVGRLRFWPSYYYAVDGFRINADDVQSPLTQADFYDLD